MPPLQIPTLNRYSIACLLLLLAALLTQVELLRNPSRLFYDQFIRSSGHSPSKEIVIVAIDQYSLDQLGRWPWPRHLHAELLQVLSPSRPKAIALNIVFAEPGTPGDDALLAQSIAQNGPVVLPILTEKASSSATIRQTLPLKQFSLAAAALGHVDAELDSDGIVRSVFLKAGLGEPNWPTFALAILQASKENIPTLPGARNHQLALTNSRSWVRDYQVFVPFAGSTGRFPQVSFADVISGTVSPALFTNKYVLVGVTASGLGKVVSTPVSVRERPLMSGVELNAHVLDGLIHKRLIEPIAKPYEFAINIFIALICVLPFISHSSVGKSAVWTSTLLIATLIFSYFVLSFLHIWFSPGTALSVIFAGFTLFNIRRLRHLLLTLFDERLDRQLSLASLNDAVIYSDENGDIQEFNQAAEELTGITASQALGRPLAEILQLQTRAKSQSYPIQILLEQRAKHALEPLVLVSKLGKRCPVQVAIKTIPGRGNKQQRVVIVLTDISKTEQLTREIAYRETHNKLTRLPNLTSIARQLKTVLNQANIRQQVVAIVSIDVDRFAKINESLGNEQGDQLLKTVVKRLKSFKYDHKRIGHIGGNEFVVVLEGIDNRASVLPIVGALRQTLGNAIVLADKELGLSFTFGVSTFPENGNEPEILLRRANTAMHCGKESGGNNIKLFTSDMQVQAERTTHVEQILHNAVAMGWVKTYYQPIIKAGNLKIVGVEALMRLHDVTGEHIGPDEFIKLAEQSGIIIQLGQYQLNEACRQLMSWQEQGMQTLRLSCNLSPRQLENPGLVSMVKEALNTSGFDPKLFEFEITESLLFENDALVNPIIEQLRKLGIQFAIDDFGTGYGSMSYLSRFPFSRLKIDKSLVWDLTKKPASHSITSAIINMAHSLKIEVIAEGVELPSQRKTLLSQGCDEVQGFLLGVPMTAQEFHDYIVKNKGIAPIDG